MTASSSEASSPVETDRDRVLRAVQAGIDAHRPGSGRIAETIADRVLAIKAPEPANRPRLAGFVPVRLSRVEEGATCERCGEPFDREAFACLVAGRWRGPDGREFEGWSHATCWDKAALEHDLELVLEPKLEPALEPQPMLWAAYWIAAAALLIAAALGVLVGRVLS